MTEQTAMNILVRSGAKWVDEAIRDNPDGPITEHTTRTRTEIEYEVTIGYCNDQHRGRLIWHKTVTFGHDDAHCGGGSAFVAAARESGDVAFAALELLESRRPTTAEPEEPREQCGDCGAEVLGHHACPGVPGGFGEDD